MRAVLLLAAAGICAMICAAQAPATAGNKAPASKAASSPAKSGTPAKSKAAVHTTASRTTTATARKSTGRRTVAVRTAWKPRQIQPTPERYQEIQNALVAKGYLRPEQATGAWDQNSIEALKRFQTEEKLDPTGKITAMSLIALGLGPKHDSTAVAPATTGN
jgi:Putative peptidoglycan binding domain